MTRPNPVPTTGQERSIFGKIISAVDVENAVESFIRLMQADYLAEVAAQAGMSRGDLPLFRSFPRLVDMTKWEEDQTPTCIIAAPGTLQQPTVRSRQLNVRWALGLGCIVAAKDMESTMRLCQLYTAALRTMIMQNQSLGGTSDGVVYLSERYDQMNPARNIAAGVVQFGVDVLGITDISQGLGIPSLDATISSGSWPEVSTTQIDVKKVN